MHTGCDDEQQRKIDTVDALTAENAKLRAQLAEAVQLLRDWKAQGDIVYVAGWYTSQSDIVNHELLDIRTDDILAAHTGETK